MENIIAVIPALEKNKYSDKGDLAEFGDVTLVEWKLIQISEFLSPDKIYVSTPSKNIENKLKRYECNFVHRDEGLSLSEMIVASVEGLKAENILWANVTSPFIGPRVYKDMIDKFEGLDKNEYDSIIAVSKIEEYIIFNGSPLNFSYDEHVSRKKIEPVYKITNGCFIAPIDTCLKSRKYYGEKPFMYEVGNMASLEIKDVEHYSIATDLISLYYKNELNI